MIKVIRDLVDSPTLMVLCDGPCASVVNFSIPEGLSDDLKFHGAVAVEAVKQGWSMRMDRQLCPFHARKEVVNGKLVQPVSRSAG